MKLEASRRFRLRDIIVLHIAAVTPEEEKPLADFATQLSDSTRIPVVILQEGMALESLSDAQMARAGWTRLRTNGHKE